jgi:mono/diheme cytochrome c family protein
MIQRFAHILRTGFLAAAVLLLLGAPLHAQGDGAALFKTKCAACHGADGSGDTAMGKTLKIRDLRSADVQKQTDAQLTEITTNGKGKMPAYKGKLTDEQIKQLVAVIRDLAKKK